mgnify:CR=1 FL=1
MPTAAVAPLLNGIGVMLVETPVAPKVQPVRTALVWVSAAAVLPDRIVAVPVPTPAQTGIAAAIAAAIAAVALFGRQAWDWLAGLFN